jgi:hypothetical protein
MKIRYFFFVFVVLIILTVVMVGCSKQGTIKKNEKSVPIIEKRMLDKDHFIRRVVTGHRNGRSVILDDAQIPKPVLDHPLDY